MSKTELELDKKTPLYNKHTALGAKMISFAGWIMPLSYTGIIAEHLHARSKAALFDVCHMGEFILKGKTALEDVSRLVTCRIDDMPDGKCRYGCLLNEKGTIVDDLIVFRISKEEYMLIVNSGTIQKDIEWIRGHLSSETEFCDESYDTAKLDLQGPLSEEVLGDMVDPSILEGIKRYSFVFVEIDGVKVLLSRTGYTGEKGFELLFPVEHAEKLWDKLLSYDAVSPAGLGARDTLRLEMGYSLYGRDIDEDHTPLDANLARFVYMEKDFIGKQALLSQENEGVGSRLTAFLCESRRSARDHSSVMIGGKKAGEVTSSAFSPCMKKGMGLCYIEPNLFEEDREVLLTDGRIEVKAQLKNMPIYKRGR